MAPRRAESLAGGGFWPEKAETSQRDLLLGQTSSLDPADAEPVPYFLTHKSMQDTDVAIDPSTVRLSVGLEHTEDLVADLDQALAVTGM